MVLLITVILLLITMINITTTTTTTITTMITLILLIIIKQIHINNNNGTPDAEVSRQARDTVRRKRPPLLEPRLVLTCTERAQLVLREPNSLPDRQGAGAGRGVHLSGSG